QTLPTDALSTGKVGLSVTSAKALAVDGGHRTVTVIVGGERHAVPVSAVLGPEAVGALAGAMVGVMPLSSMQALLGEPGRVTRVLVEPAAGQRAAVRSELRRLAGAQALVGSGEEDVALLK